MKIPLGVPVINEKPCGLCSEFFAIKNALDKRGEQTFANHGWCVKASLFPHTEQPGQEFPSGAKRAGKGDLASPYIVHSDEIQHGCPNFSLR